MVSPWDCFVKHPYQVMLDAEVQECVSVWLNGAHDDVANSSTDQWHAFRVGTKVIASDEQGFDYGYHYAEPAHAIDVMVALHEVEAEEEQVNEDEDPD